MTFKDEMLKALNHWPVDRSKYDGQVQMLDVVGVEDVEEQDHQVRSVEVPELDKENQGRIFIQHDMIPKANFPTTSPIIIFSKVEMHITL